MSDELRIPSDPERMRFHNNNVVATLQKYRHYVMCIIGTLTLRELEKRGLMVVPKEMFFKLLEQSDKEAFDAISSNPMLTNPQEKKQ
ncbi:MAG: hypothetical protein KKA76_07305 [Proteobacteria bacterium]|nr:hypothetical protein [Pseudomonadota bacterium]